MSVELVTGYYGVDSGGKPKRHVSSTEDGARQAGTVGTGMYVLSTGSKLSASMEDANTLVVADGDVMMNGRHVSLPDPTSFTIPTGVQGQKVSNLAVLRYEKVADSVESVTPVVLTGEPSADTPTDPAYNEGSILDGDSPVDMPLYRVVTDGINAEDPVPLFEVVRPISGKADVPVPVSQGGTGATDTDGAVRALGLASLKENAPYMRFPQSSNTRAYSGTVVVTFSGSKGTLFTATSIKSLIGRAFNQSNDMVAVMNADENANYWVLLIAAYNPTSGNINLTGKYGGTKNTDISGPVRVNYFVVARG